MPRSENFICGLDAAVSLVEGKWKPLVLWELHTGVRRFSELRDALPGVSEKVLAQQLRQLERDGLVRREVFAEVPPRVEYSLTAFGESLNSALEPLGEWGHNHMDRIANVRGGDIA
jgi:DNA-binding HxlR family transcriptional regulator